VLWGCATVDPAIEIAYKSSLFVPGRGQMEKKQKSASLPAWAAVVLVVVACLLSASIGGGISRHWGASEYTISYADFVQIMLTAISLLITLLAVFLAVLGVIGWTSIEQRVHQKTEAYLAKLDEGIQRRAEEAIREKTNAMMYEGVQPIDLDADRDDVAEER
jgi:membrane protein implicated in regulation of membrane protease activity